MTHLISLNNPASRNIGVKHSPDGVMEYNYTMIIIKKKFSPLPVTISAHRE